MFVKLTWNERNEKWYLKDIENGAFIMDLPDCANTRKLFGVGEDRKFVMGKLIFEEDRGTA